MGVVADVGLGSLSVDVVSLAVDAGCICSVRGDDVTSLLAAHACHALLQFCAFVIGCALAAAAASEVAFIA